MNVDQMTMVGGVLALHRSGSGGGAWGGMCQRV
jgi:hypothetical protein